MPMQLFFVGLWGTGFEWLWPVLCFEVTRLSGLGGFGEFRAIVGHFARSMLGISLSLKP